MSPRWLSLLVAFAPVLRAQTLPPAQQITSSTDAITNAWSNRTTAVSGGQIQFAGSDDTLYLYNGTSVQAVQATVPGQAIEPTVMMLGTNSTSGVIGGWRRDAGVGWVSINGGTPHTEDYNPEHLSIGSGCVFMVLQTGDPTLGNQVYQINPADASRTRIGTDAASANHGAFRVYNNGCSSAAIGWLEDDGTNDIKYWNGTTLTKVDTVVDYSNFSFGGGKIAYIKLDGNGVPQIYLVDTSVSLAPVQLTSETDPTIILRRPQTDGRHVAWYRSNADGSNAQLVLNGGVAFPTGPLGSIELVEFPFQLNRGQLLWTNGAPNTTRTFFYDDGTTTYTIDPSPATSINTPWLTDGYIAFLGPTASSGTDKEVFRITVTPPSDSQQPSPPLIVLPTPGTAQVRFDSIAGATSYNAYVAYAPGVTRDNYASLAGGRKITGVTSGFTIPNIPGNTTYYVAITAVQGSTEGPSSRVGSTTILANTSWHSVGGLGTTQFYSVAADPSNASLVYAGADGSVYKSSDGGMNWTQTLSHATTGATRTAALAVGSSGVFANMMTQATIWRSVNNGTSWTNVLSNATGFGEQNGSLAIDPVTPTTIYAGDFKLPNYDFNADSLVIKSTDGGSNWNFTSQGPNGGNDDIHAYALAINPSAPLTLYAGGTGTPTIAKSTDGTASWSDLTFPNNNGGVYSIAIQPSKPSTLWAATGLLGVFKSMDAGGTWTNQVDGSLTSTEYAILVDPQDPNYIHLATANGYWRSLDGGATWNPVNSGFTGTAIYGLAMTAARHLIAATDAGLFFMSLAQQPTIASVSPNACNIAGGANVTISGSGFLSGASVTFGGTAATNVNVISANTITVTTPAHAAGAVDVVVTNPDFLTATLVNGFTFTNAPSVPANVSATGQSTSTVLVTWAAVSSATSYQVFRNDGVGYGSAIPAASNSYMDSGLAATTSHQYKVRAVNASGASGDSASDIATTIVFPEAITPGATVVKAAHLTELRNAVNAVRHLAGKGDYPFTDSPAAGLLIKAIHVSELRAALDDALSALGLTAGGYTDAVLIGVRVKAVHFQELRNRVQ